MKAVYSKMRDRLLDGHSHLTSSEIPRAAEGTLDVVRARHLRGCEQCSQLVQSHRSTVAMLRDLQFHDDVDPSSECVSNEDVAALVSGELDQATVQKFMDHIVTCHRCGLILNAAVPPDESESSSSVPGAVVTLTPKTRPSPGTFRRLLGAAIAASLLLAAAGSWIWYRNANEPELLLAKAYTQTRPFAYRLPDAGYAEVKQERDASVSVFDRPEALTKAEAIIQHDVQEKPGDSRLLLLKARAEMLEGQYKAAITTFKAAEELKPLDPDAMSDLAIAYALAGDVENQYTGYGKAIDLLQGSLRKNPNQPLALFNLALIYERMSNLTDAVDTWSRFLQTKPPARWKQEAERRLASLQKAIGKRSDLRNRITSNESRFLSLARMGKASHPENYVDIAWTKWLPNNGRDGPAQALALLSQMLVACCRDTELRDVTRESGPGDLPADVRQLTIAISQNLQGEADEAAHNASLAAPALEKSHRPAAALRAETEELYGTYRAGHYAKCLELAKPLERKLGPSSYHWMHALVLQTDADCLAMSGEIGQAHARAISSYAAASNFNFPNLSLRALSFVSNEGKTIGKHTEAWRAAAEGLRTYWQSDVPSTREYQFSFDLADSANLLGWQETAVVFAKDAVRASDSMENRLVAALGRVHYAAYLETAGYHTEASRELERADTEFSRLKPDLTVQTYRLDARLQRARIELARHHPDEALELASDVPELPTPQLKENSYLISGLALTQLTRKLEADDRFRHAIEIYNRELLSLASPSERMRAAARVAPAYRALVRDLFFSHNTEESLRTWEQFRDSLTNLHRIASPSLRLADPEAAILIYVAVDPDILAWVVDDQGVEAHRIRNASQLKLHASRFVQMCSSPASHLSELRREARALDTLLIEPFSSRLAHKRHWYVQADDWLSSLPFTAFVDDTGHYLIANASITSVDSIPQSGAESYSLPSLANARVSVAAISAAGDRSAIRYLDSVKSEADNIAAHYPGAVLLLDANATKEKVLHEISKSSIFHFAGHALSRGGAAALVLGRSADGTTNYLTSSDLLRTRPIRCSLAVLAACDTADGEQEGPYNPDTLVRAFLFAGTRTVIATRWNVDGNDTRELMSYFYDALAHTGPEEALAAACRNMSARLPHPYDWGGFSIYSTLNNN
jgi:CHAT domain-containing protein/cytochrome c-type biogenesis protein CcmH/NrfG